MKFFKPSDFDKLSAKACADIANSKLEKLVEALSKPKKKRKKFIMVYGSSYAGNP